MNRLLLPLLGFATACVYTPLELGADGLPPVAVIGDGEPTYRVGASANVVLDGSRSHDPDGGELTFLWAIEDGCTNDTLELTALEAQRVVFTSNAGGECAVSLTVTDEDGKTDTAEAVVEVVAVGAYVRSGGNCVERDDPPAGFVGKGTQDNPWCSPLDGVAAAVEFHLTDVWIANGDYTIAAPFEIPPGVEIHGGRDATGWQQSPVHSNIGLAGAAQVVFLPGHGAALSGVAVYRTETCGRDCDLVYAQRASLRITDVVIGARDVSGNYTVGDVSPSGIARSLHIVSGDGVVSISVTNSTIVVPYQVGQSYGIVLDGRRGELTGAITDVTINNGGQAADVDTVAGIRTLATDGVEVRDVTLLLDSNYSGSSHAFGLLDGSGAGPLLNGAALDVACDDACEGSSGLEVLNSSFTVISLTMTAGIALFGTSQSAVRVLAGDHSVISVGGDTTLGLWTYETQDVTVQGGAYRALCSGDGGDSLNLTAGILDGAAEITLGGGPLAFWGGSSGLAIDAVEAHAELGSNRSQDLAAAGMALAGTEDSQVVESGFSTGTSSVTQPQIAVGLWTVATTGVTLAHNDCRPHGAPSPPAAAANKVAVAMGDGWVEPDVAAQFGSTGLLAIDNHLDVDLSAWSPTSLVACVAWADSTGGELRDNTVACTSPPRDGLHGILLVDTDNADVAGNIVGWLPGDDIVFPGAMVGMRDGINGYFPGSTGLRVRKNRIFTSGGRADAATGIWIDHELGSPMDTIAIENNAIHGIAQQVGAGILVANAEAEIVNNTIHGGQCFEAQTGGQCDSPLTTFGIDVRGASHDGPRVWIANNLIHPGHGRSAFAISDDGYDSSTGATSLSLLQANAFAVPQGSYVEHLCIYSGMDALGGAECSSSTAFANLCALQPEPDNFTDNATPANPPMCADWIHLDPTQDLAQLQDAGDLDWAPPKDIDHDDRSDFAPDIGADEVSGPTCPPG